MSVLQGILAAAVLATAAAGLVPGQPAAELPQDSAARTALFVRGQGTDDAPGTAERPLRTLTAALARARESDRPTDVHVSVGTYDSAAGERFPLDLTGGVRLFGIGSEVARVDAGDAPVALRVGTEAPGRVIVSGLAVRGSGVGLALGASEDAGVERAVALRDLLLEGQATGIALELGTADAPLPITLEASGLRTRNVDFGLRALGEGHLRLELSGCDLRDGTVGLSLESDPDEDVSEPRAADEEGVARVHHDLRVRDTTIAGMSRAGVLRVGRDGRNRGGPYRFEGCTFRGNRVGIELRRPCLDTRLVVQSSRFLDNQQFGLRATGFLGSGREDAPANLLEDCLFRWNGVGAHVTNSQAPLVVRRSRFLDNVGNGLFVSNFMSDPTRALVESSLFARNGSFGIYSLADARLQSVAIRSCTIVDNDAGGVKDHRRHSGSSEFELRGCIVSGNGRGTPRPLDLVELDPRLVSHSLIGTADGLDAVRTALAAQGNLLGVDPGFVDRALGDYRLAPDSPCRGALAAEARPGLPETDLTGASLPPADEPASLGCYAASAAGSD